MVENQIRPQAGPQEAFLSSSADIAIFGGSAGGGKSYGLLLEPLRHCGNPKFGAVIFRRESVEIRKQGGLWDESAGLYGLIDGASAREQNLDWRWPSGARISFSHLERESTKYAWKGSQIPLLCCEETERVRMGDGSLKQVRQIRAGDAVQTLQGPRKILFAGLRRKEPCVHATVRDNNGKVLGRQIHSVSHKVLTPAGWFSYSDYSLDGQCLGDPSSIGPESVSRGVCKCFGPCGNTCQSAKQFRDSHILGQELTSKPALLHSHHMALSEPDVCKVQLTPGIDCEVSACAPRVPQPLSSVIHRVMLHAPLPQSVGRGNEGDFPHGESAYVRCACTDEGSRAYCSSLHGQCGAPEDLQECNTQHVFQQLADVAARTRKDLPSGDQDKAQKYSRRKLRYAHPYVGSERIAVEPVLLGSCEMVPCGERWVIDLTVEEENHYITELGLVNKNCFDELTGFTKSQFFYMLSRNRSVCGVKPYVRATTNPDADSWVAQFISWWIDWDTGYAIPERSGKLRWFLRRGEDFIWSDTKQQLLADNPDAKEVEPKSVTFILSKLEDNKILMEKDPGYEGNLRAQDIVERERLLKGNWKIRPSAGLYFKRSYFPVVEVAPAEAQRVRCWDLAATDAEEGGTPDWTVGMRMSRDANGRFYIEHIERMQASPEKVERALLNTAALDGLTVAINIPQDPGQAGKMQAKYLVSKLAGYNVHTARITGDKVTRASPASAQAEAGNISVVRGAWNEAFFAEVENFPSAKGKDDQVDTLSDCIYELTANVIGDRPFIRRL